MKLTLEDTEMFLWMKKTTLIKFTPLVLILLNLILKFSFITSNSIAGDEPFSIYHAQMSLSSILDLMKSENNPPLHFILLHFWIKLFGISALSVRFLSVIFSVLCAYVMYLIGLKFFSYRVGVVAGLLFTFSNLNLLLAHEARVYELFALLSALSMYYFLSVKEHKNRNIFYAKLLITNILLVYSHYFGFFIIFIQSISVLLFKDIRKPLLKSYLIYLLLFVCLYIPNMLILLNRFSVSSHGTWLGNPGGITGIYEMLWSFSNQPVTTVICITILAVALVKMLFTKQKTNNATNKMIILLWFSFPFFFMFFISYWMPIFLDRYLVFVSLGYYLTIALSSCIILQNKFQDIFLGIVIVLFLATFYPDKDNKRHVKETVAKVQELKGENASIIICPSFFMLNYAYYYDKSIFSEIDNGNSYAKITQRLNSESIYPINSADLIPNTKNKIVYLDAAADFSFPDNNLYNTLNQKYKLKNTFKFYEIFNVYEFEKQ